MSKKESKIEDSSQDSDAERSGPSEAPESAVTEDESAAEAQPAEGDTADETTEKPASEAGTEEGEEGEEKEEEVPYDLIEATKRAGSIVDIKFKVAYAEYDRKTAEFYKELRQSVIIDGFRKGKAPLKLIQNRYHKEVKQDTLDFLLENCLAQISKEKEYSPLRRFDRVDPEVSAEEDLTFSISFEIRPQVDATGYDDIQVTVDARKIDDATVEAEIEKLRHRHATYETAETLPYSAGCGVTVDILVRDDKGKEIEDLTRKDLFLAHPENSLPEQVVSCLNGQQAGDSFTSEVPSVRYSEGGVITSEQDSYFVKVREVKQEVLPELDDDFAQDVGGFESIDALRAEIRKQLDANEARRLRDQTLEKIYDVLIERNPMELPATLVREMQDELIREHRERLSLLGLRLEDLGEDPQDYVVRTQRNAERMLKVILLNQSIAQKENIEATDADVDKAIERRAEAEGRKPLAIRARLEASRAMDRFRQDLKHDLVDDRLIERAQVNKQFVAAESKIVTRDKP